VGTAGGAVRGQFPRVCGTGLISDQHKTTVYRRWPTNTELVMDAVEDRSAELSPLSVPHRMGLFPGGAVGQLVSRG